MALERGPQPRCGHDSIRGTDHALHWEVASGGKFLEKVRANEPGRPGEEEARRGLGF